MAWDVTHLEKICRFPRSGRGSVCRLHCADYQWAEPVGNVTVSYSDEYLSDGTLDPALTQDSYTKYDASLGVEASTASGTCR